MRVFGAIVAVVWTLGFFPVQGQSLKGIYWEPPAHREDAYAALLKMKRGGVEALRTPLIEDERILYWIDSLGIWLFQDLPLEGLTWRELRDTMDYASHMLREVLVRAQPYTHARYFGLLANSDVADGRMQPYVDTLARIVRNEGPPGSVGYYRTFFRQSDRAHDAVDLVLLDLLDVPEPAQALMQGASRKKVRVGIGSLGTYVDDNILPDDVHAAHSAMHQAYYLEQALRHMQGIPLFVYRWKDAFPSEDGSRCASDAWLPRGYGLHDQQGHERPSWEVVSGLFTGEGKMFLFPSGDFPVPSPYNWIRFMGVLALLGFPLLWAAFPMVRRTTLRFFGARFFYVEALRRAEVPGIGVLLLLLGVWAWQQGVTLWIFWEMFRAAEASVRLLCVWNGQVRVFWQTLLLEPWLTVPWGIVGFLLIVAMLLLMAYLFTREKWRVSSLLTLVLWPFWTGQIVLLAGLLLTTFPVEVQLRLLGPGVLGWLLTYVWVVFRVLMDVGAGVRKRWLVPFGGLLILALGIFLLYESDPAMWHFALHVVRELTSPIL